MSLYNHKAILNKLIKINTESAKCLASAMGPLIMSVLFVLNFKGHIDNVSNSMTLNIS